MKTATNLRKAANWAPPAILTTVSLGWSVYAIGDLLAEQAYPAFAYSAAALYDGIWLYALYQEAEHHRQGSDGKTPRYLGWGFLVVSVAVLFGHGMLASNWLAAVTGAIIPVLSKVTIAMAKSADAVRISPDAQRKIEAIRAGTRDRVALARVSGSAKATGYVEEASLLRAEHEALGAAHSVRHDARTEYDKVLKDKPLPSDAEAFRGVPERLGLITDEDLAAFLEGPIRPTVPGDETAGGTPDGTDSSSVPGTDGSVPGTAENKALQLAAAEVYAEIEAEGIDDPPTQREFRRRLRDVMVQRHLKCSNEYVADLYRHELSIRNEA